MSVALLFEADSAADCTLCGGPVAETGRCRQCGARARLFPASHMTGGKLSGLVSDAKMPLLSESVWDPEKHPRARGGMFAEVLAGLHANGAHSLPGGVHIEKSLVGWKIRTRDGKSVSRLRAEDAVQHGLSVSQQAPPSGRRTVDIAHAQRTTAAAGLFSQGDRSQDASAIDLVQPSSQAHAQALVDAGLATDMADARAQLAQMRPRAAQGDKDERMIARRTRIGHNEADSRTLLAQLRSTVSEKNLPSALAFHGFITNREAERMQLGDDAPKRNRRGTPIWQGSRIEGLRHIVATHQAHEVDGHEIDVQTANMLTKVHDAISPANQAKFGDIPLPKLIDFGWSRVR